MIQTRWGHLNRGYSLLTRVQAMFLDGHLLLEQTARSRSGRFFNFNGTAGLWRRTCVEDAGGWLARKTVEMYGSRREAEIAEGKAIRSESPLHNIAMGRTDPEAPPHEYERV